MLLSMNSAAVPVYTFGPTFRAEESHTKRHLSEFYMIEAEIPFTKCIEDVANVGSPILHSLHINVV